MTLLILKVVSEVVDESTEYKWIWK